MGRFSALRVLSVRAAIGAGSAWALARVFRPEADPGYVLVLAGLLVGAAYLLESLRKR